MAVYERNPNTGVETTVAGIQDLSVYESRISDIEEVIPSDATSSNQLITESDLGTAAAKDFTDTVRPNSHDLVESNAVYSAINNALSSIYTPRGSLTCAELTSSLLIDANVGNVYEMSDAGTTTALFIQGAGETIGIGDNVGIIKAGSNTYLFNLMGNAFDLTDYQKKDLASAVEGATTVEGALGVLSTNKASKVSNATAGDIASLNANGNLVDSGVVASSVIRRVNSSTPVDCNDLIDRFTEYRVGDGDANRPTTGSEAYIIRTFKTGAESTVYSQIAYQIAGTAIYIRRRFSDGVWSSWDKLVTESDLAVTTTTITKFGKDFTFKRAGNVVTLYSPYDIYPSAKEPINAGENFVGTLDSDFRPLNSVTAPLGNNRLNEAIWLKISTNGDMYLYSSSALTSTHNGAFTISYVID